jgi:hypothetical protein
VRPQVRGLLARLLPSGLWPTVKGILLYRLLVAIGPRLRRVRLAVMRSAGWVPLTWLGLVAAGCRPPLPVAPLLISPSLVPRDPARLPVSPFRRPPRSSISTCLLLLPLAALINPPPVARLGVSPLGGPPSAVVTMPLPPLLVPSRLRA